MDERLKWGAALVVLGVALGVSGAMLLAGSASAPLSTLFITHAYGEQRKGYIHKGVDIRAPEGTPLRAPFAGIVGHWQSDRAGLGLSLTSPEGVSLRLMHLSAYSVPDGEPVEAGDLIGLSGATGVDIDGKPVFAHVHLETLVNGQHRDPVELFPSWPWAGRVA